MIYEASPVALDLILFRGTYSGGTADSERKAWLFIAPAINQRKSPGSYSAEAAMLAIKH